MWGLVWNTVYYAMVLSWISDDINSLMLNRFWGNEEGEKNDLLYLPWNKIQSATVFNAIFFIISQAYVATTTDDEVSCWAELSSMLSIFILIRGMSKLFVTFVKGFVEDKTSNYKITSLELYWIFKSTFPRIKCLITKPGFLMELCLE